MSKEFVSASSTREKGISREGGHLLSREGQRNTQSGRRLRRMQTSRDEETTLMNIESERYQSTTNGQRTKCNLGRRCAVLSTIERECKLALDCNILQCKREGQHHFSEQNCQKVNRIREQPSANLGSKKEEDSPKNSTQNET